MKIGGIQKTTLIDYPGKLACTVFLSGCNFRCPWCYSRELVIPDEIQKHPETSQKEVFDFLEKRKGLLEGVVICGGEPTINKNLPQFIKKIKDLGFSVKLDTNGSNPKMLKQLIDQELIDYVAMDVKVPKQEYSKIFEAKISPEDIEKSINILKRGKVNYEFRTTVVPEVLEKEDIIKIAKWIKGANKYYLQKFRPQKTIDPKFQKVKPYSDNYIKKLKQAASEYVEKCKIR